LDQKKSLSLCYCCRDKFFPGHKCKTKGIHLLEEEDDSPDFLDHSLDNLAQSPYDVVFNDNQSLISMCAFNNSSKHNTFNFQGQIGNLNIIAMVDSDSTHSFINPTIVSTLSLPTVTSFSLTIITASGNKLSTNILCEQQEFQLSNHKFTGDFRVLQIISHGLLLGMD
jgi:Retroviral aspartyl protease